MLQSITLFRSSPMTSMMFSCGTLVLLVTELSFKWILD